MVCNTVLIHLEGRKKRVYNTGSGRGRLSIDTITTSKERAAISDDENFNNALENATDSFQERKTDKGIDESFKGKIDEA